MRTRGGAWLPSPVLDEQESGDRGRLGIVAGQAPGLLSPSPQPLAGGLESASAAGKGKGSGKGKKHARQGSRASLMSPQVRVARLDAQPASYPGTSTPCRAAHLSPQVGTDDALARCSYLALPLLPGVHIDRQAYRHIDRHAYRHIDRQAYRHMDRQAYGQTGIQTVPGSSTRNRPASHPHMPHCRPCRARARACACCI